jgi:ribosomal protein L29
MKIKEIAEKRNKELVKFITDSKAKLLKLSFDVRTKESNKVRDIRALRRDIARALTVKKEREIVNQEQEALDKKDNKK